MRDLDQLRIFPLVDRLSVVKIIDIKPVFEEILQFIEPLLNYFLGLFLENFVILAYF